MENSHEPIDESMESFGDKTKPFTPQSFDLWPETLNHKQIMEFTGLSHKQAWTALSSDRIYRPFPDKRRNMIVGKFALRDFLNGRVIEKEDFV